MNPVDSLRLGDPHELPLQASKWLSVQLLIDRSEMENLLNALGHIHIFLVGSICNQGEGYISTEEFVSIYGKYIDYLQAGKIPEERLFRPTFSSVFTLSDECLFRVATNDGRHIVRVSKPVVQLQLHKMDYSSADGKFRPMVFSQESIFWGIQFSYPQLFQDAVSKEIFQVADTPAFPNTSLFRSLQKWMRQNTIPTPCLVNQQRINVPIRLGKMCMPWIHHHPQLQQKGIHIVQSN